jgi:hypothetical protein
MRIAFRWTVPIVPIAVLSALAGPAAAQDHEKCYKIKDPVKLSGTLDLTTPQFGLEPGCVVGPAKYFCAPASKSNVAVIDKATKLPIEPLLFNAPPATVDRICYKIKCPVPPPPFPPDQNVTDQFGNRTLTKFKAAFMCTPAGKGAAYCGNSVIDPGEECDSTALGACTVGCQPDCTCTCEQVCCYMEDFFSPNLSTCVESTGTPAQVASFTVACLVSEPLLGRVHFPVPGPCTVGVHNCGPVPMEVPSDSSCP